MMTTYGRPKHRHAYVLALKIKGFGLDGLASHCYITGRIKKTKTMMFGRYLTYN